MAIAAALPSLASAYAYTAHDATGDNYVKNKTEGLPLVWQQNQVSFSPRFNQDGVNFNAGVTSALTEWNQVGTRLQWQLGDASAAPCQNDGVNSGGWRNGVLCGGGTFGDVLAVTVRNYRKTDNGPWHHYDTDVILDASREWDIYDGELRQNSSGFPVYDFRRVILHELGHAAGLDHPDETTPPQDVAAIMNSKTSDLHQLQPDDKLGLQTIYAVSSNDNSNSGTSSGARAVSGGGGAWGWLLAPLCWRVLAMQRPLSRLVQDAQPSRKGR